MRPRFPTHRPGRDTGWKATVMVTGLGLLAGGSTGGAEVDPSRLPPAAGRTVDYAVDIQPLFERACLRCHGPERPKGGFRLDDLESALKGGDLGPSIIPGDGAKSPLVHYVARLVEDMEMPPVGKGDPLSADEVGLLRAWIDQGAKGAGPAKPEFGFSVTPAMQFVWVEGNEARFREYQWMREGWGGGASEFSLKYDQDPRTHVAMEGRAMAGPDDYRVRVRVDRDDLGWVGLEYREFSRFRDDTGWYYAPFGTPAPRLGEDLVVRNQHARAEVGLQLPRWPRLRLAYDLNIRNGSETTLNWDTVSVNGVDRKILPGRKRIDETTHLLTLDVDYDWDGLLISDQAQFEWHEQNNQRTDARQPDFATLVTDQQDYWRGANVLRLERSLRDWLQVSGGYLYSQLRDAGGFGVESLVPVDPSLPPTLDITADDLTLRRRSHVVNGNALLGPWEQLHFYAGLQAEWTRSEGFAMGRDLRLNPALTQEFSSSNDRSATDETFGLRYAGIPATVVFAETRFQQETYGQNEEGLADGSQEFLRETDAEGDLKDYEVGFNVSPWRSVSFQAKYRYRDRRNDFDHPRDFDVFGSGNGYPAFITARDTQGDEVETRLVLQPLRWLKTTLKYSISATDYETTTVAWDGFDDLGNPFTGPAGTVQAGEYDAQTVSAGIVLTPWSRLYLGTTVGWTSSRTRSSANNGRESVPYEGETWTLLESVTYLLDEKTDLLATYVFSTADYEQDNEDFGLPMGIAYTRHALTAGIGRHFKGDRMLRLEYGFYQYDEPTLGGAADYTAHGLFASFRIPWR